MKEIKVYTTSWCGPCKMAKRLLDEKNLDYTEIDIEEKGWSREDLFKKTGGRTVPQIVIEGETIGGYDDLIIYGEPREAIILDKYIIHFFRAFATVVALFFL